MSGTLIDPLKLHKDLGAAKDAIDIERFFEHVMPAYGLGQEDPLPADHDLGRSLIPAGTGVLRDFSYIAPDLPILDAEKCVGCMECVTQCPDTAILGKVLPRKELAPIIEAIEDEKERGQISSHWNLKTQKYANIYEKKGKEPGAFGIFIDPTKCKGCGECIEVCGEHDALTMVRKNDEIMDEARLTFAHYLNTPPTPDEYINEKILGDMMLADQTLLFVGGAGSCAGCGEVTALRMMLAATGFQYGRESIGLVAATGCNTVYGSTYPYNPFLVPWTNSLFENAAAMGLGVRKRWDQIGWQDKKIWVIGGDGAMVDIGFQATSRLLASGLDVNVIILDTQAYSNTGGQTSTTTYMGQEAKMSSHGKFSPGKGESRKEVGMICMMHPDTYVAQTTAALPNHFYKCVMEANAFKGPSVLNVYTTCQPEHGVGDAASYDQARLAVNSRTFPVFTHDPRKGDRLSERLSLAGNPAVKKDWYVNPKTNEEVTFVDFARTEGRFFKQFDEQGNPSKVMLATKAERLKNWHQLQDLAGVA